MPVCAACGKDNPDEARFCLSCGAAFETEEPGAREVRKTVTVLFCDVTGSTALGERLDPESMRRVMGRYFEGTKAVLERHGGTVEKFIGDAVMAVFGIPTLHEDDALRAVRAAAELRERLASLNRELERDFGVTLQIRTGINTGEVVAGSGQTLATGDAVNTAKRLEESAGPGEILLGEATRQLVRDAVELESLEPLPLKGKAEAVPAWRLLGVIAGAEPFARHLETRMVGRERELEQLRQAFERSREERACRLVTILGEPGIGKSKLSAEFLGRVTGEAAVLRGRCLPYGEGITYWPLVEILRQATRHEARGSILALIEGEDDAELIADCVGAAVGLVDRAFGSDETFWAVRRLLERLARERPLVVVIDDLQWAEPTFLDLLEHVAYLSSTAPILLLCLARPELLQARQAWPGASIHLEPLSKPEADSLLDRLGGAALSAESRRRITAAAEGNPLFVEQMLAMLETKDGPAEDFAVPPTIQALLGARLDRLGAAERAAIECASVVGQEFWSTALRALLPPGAGLAPTLLTLVRQELIRPHESSFPGGGESFRFVHLLVRDAAYQGMPKERRAELHEGVADWLERSDRVRGREHEEIVGYHLEQAYRYREELGPVDERGRVLAARAAERLAAAGRRALARGDASAATNLLDRAVSLLPTEDPRRLELMPELGRAFWAAGSSRGLTRC